MKTSVLVLAAAMLSLPLPVSAQNDTNNTAQSKSGTAPENRGNTGWTGGARDQKPDDNPEADALAARDQPWMAEGSDLHGTPRQFSPKKTVE
jgi:hypothetical protein